MPDTGAAGVSLAGEQQVIALRREYPELKIDQGTAEGSVVFGKGKARFKSVI
jgi:hypothetical protein